MAETLTTDLCIVGDSLGGVRAALLAAAFGVPTIWVRTGARDGVALARLQALNAAARAAHQVRQAGRFGVRVASVTIDGAGITQHLRQHEARMALQTSDARFRALGLRIIRGDVRFQSTRSLAVGADHIEARRFILALDTPSATPSCISSHHPAIWTPETIPDLTPLPRRLVVTGGNGMALALAQAFQRLDVAVTLVPDGALLPAEDREQVALLETALRREGVVIRPAAPLRSVTVRDIGGLEMAFGGPQSAVLDTDALLVTEPHLALDGLGLATAGIAADSGGIRVDERLRTDNRIVHAIGAGIARPYRDNPTAALAEAEFVMRQVLFRLPPRTDPGAVPRFCLTDPEFAAVGLTEEAARQKHGTIAVLRSGFSDNDRAQADLNPQGHAKMVLDRRRRLRGVSLTGPDATALIAGWTGRLGDTLPALRNGIPPLASFAQTPHRAVLDAYAPLARSRTVRMVSAFLRRFG